VSQRLPQRRAQEVEVGLPRRPALGVRQEGAEDRLSQGHGLAEDGRGLGRAAARLREEPARLGLGDRTRLAAPGEERAVVTQPVALVPGAAHAAHRVREVEAQAAAAQLEPPLRCRGRAHITFYLTLDRLSGQR
jgi:hypothetical protein